MKELRNNGENRTGSEFRASIGFLGTICGLFYCFMPSHVRIEEGEIHSALDLPGPSRDRKLNANGIDDAKIRKEKKGKNVHACARAQREEDREESMEWRGEGKRERRRIACVYLGSRHILCARAGELCVKGLKK